MIYYARFKGGFILKKKFLSLVMSLCLLVVGLFSFTGCSVVKENSSVVNGKIAVRVGDNDLTRSDIINAFYTYYQSNGNYFSSYDEQTIVDSFYSWTIIREIVKQKSKEALYDSETNKNGYIFYTEEEEKDVWDSTFEYIYSQVSSNEEAIYDLIGTSDEDKPIWLRDTEDEEEKSLFEEYKSSKPVITKKTASDSVKKSTDDEKKAKYEALKKYLFEYKVNPNDEDDDTRESINASDSVNRNKAYAKYIEGLANNAKSSGTETDEKTLLENEIIRIYNAYYDSKIQTLFQNYYLEEYLTDTVNGDKVSLSDKKIVEAYLKKYYTDVQVYQVEDSYISTMTNSEGASVIFYNYKGRNYFFSVQHILVKYDDYMTEKVKNLDGYSSSSSTDYDYEIYKNFLKQRNELTDNYTMLTEINKDVQEQFGDCLTVLGDYYYYDSKLEGDSIKNYGYIKVTVSGEEEKTYTRTDNGETVDEADVKFMATAKEIVDAYNENVEKWEGILKEYLSGDDTKKEELRTTYENTAYLFDVIDNMESYATESEIKNKLSSLLFVEIQWIYSSDSLDNKTSNKIGYIISNYPDENGSWVADFAYGARELMAQIASNSKTNADVDYTNIVTSNYGYHIIKVENVYSVGSSLVDMSKLTKKIDLEDEEFVAEMAKILRETYVSTSSNQTVYDYFYDDIYNTLVGSSDSSGTYFLKLQYEWLNDYESSGNTKIVNKMTYDELMDSIN